MDTVHEAINYVLPYLKGMKVEDAQKYGEGWPAMATAISILSLRPEPGHNDASVWRVQCRQAQREVETLREELAKMQDTVSQSDYDKFVQETGEGDDWGYTKDDTVSQTNYGYGRCEGHDLPLIYTDYMGNALCFRCVKEGLSQDQQKVVADIMTPAPTVSHETIDHLAEANNIDNSPEYRQTYALIAIASSLQGINTLLASVVRDTDSTHASLRVNQ